MQPELSDLPPGWCWTALGMIAEITHGIIKGRNRLRPPPMRPVAYLRGLMSKRRSWVSRTEANYNDAVGFGLSPILIILFHTSLGIFTVRLSCVASNSHFCISR